MPNVENPTPDDYRLSLPNTEIAVHREAHVVYLIDMADRDPQNLQELAKWYLDHGWFLDAVHVEPEASPQDVKDVLRDPAGKIISRLSGDEE